MTLYMGLLETQGNQAYIYATNRERNARGASELLQAATTTWVLHAVGVCEENESLTLSRRTEILRAQKTDVLDGGPGTYVVIATSGRAVLLSDSRDSLVDVISKVTTRALKEAPGLIVVGAVVEASADTPITEVQRRAAVRIGTNLSRLPAPSARTPQIPIVQRCALTNLPAETTFTSFDNRIAVSKMVARQRDAASDSLTRLGEVLSMNSTGGTLADDVNNIPSRGSWRAVIHADGNRVGTIFMELDKYFWGNTGTYWEKLRRWALGYQCLSSSLELATERAFASAASEVGAEKVFPILLGGDDITVETSADIAWHFTLRYLESFEQETGKVLIDENLRVHLVPGATLPDNLSAAAGIAVVKAGFPFHSAYDLSEALLDSAKTAKNADGEGGPGRSAIDIHVLYDSLAHDLSEMRTESSNQARNRRMWGGPYVIGERTPHFSSVADLDALCDAVSGKNKSRQVQVIAKALADSDAAADTALKNARSVNPALAVLNKDLAGLVKAGTPEQDGRTLLRDAIWRADVEQGAPRHD